MTEKQKKAALSRLRAMLKEETQAVVGARLGYTAAYVSMVVNGKSAVSEAFAEALGVV